MHPVKQALYPLPGLCPVRLMIICPLLSLQATAVAGGGHHSAALLIPRAADSKDPRHSLYCFGRGESTNMAALLYSLPPNQTLPRPL